MSWRICVIKGVSETIKNEVKEQKGGLLSMLLGTLGGVLLGNLFASKGTIREGTGEIAKSHWQGTIRASQDF